MEYGKVLPATGAVIVVGGVAIGYLWLVITAVIATALFIAGIRLFFRRAKKVGEQ